MLNHIDNSRNTRNRPKTIAALTLFALLVFIQPGKANLRAPGFANFEGSGSLKKSFGTVLSEKLDFVCDPPYTAKHIKNADMASLAHFAYITATYTIEASADMDISTSFVLADPLPITVRIDNHEIKTGNPVRISAENAKPRTWRTHNTTLYEASFSGRLTKGTNEIMIRYRQPMSFFETHYGYFTTSRFSTSFTYELWPLREWILSESFHLAITVSTKDDTGLLKPITGSDYRIRIYGDMRGEKKPAGSRIELKQKSLDTPGNILSVETGSGIEFPDILTVEMGYTDDMK